MRADGEAAPNTLATIPASPDRAGMIDRAALSAFALALIAVFASPGCSSEPAPRPEIAGAPPVDAPPPPASAHVVVATWNAGGLLSPVEVADRADDIAALAVDVRPDVLLLDEVNSRETAEAVARAMGLPTGPEHVVVSDFNPNDDARYSSLEVAILSRFPLTEAVEFDRGTDGNSRPGYPRERKLERVDLDGIVDMGVGRGFLAADVPALVVAVTHLKSSSGRLGDADRDNVRKREIVAAAMVRQVAEPLRVDRGTHVNGRRVDGGWPDGE